MVFLGSKPWSYRQKRAGNVIFFAKSPDPPKITIVAHFSSGFKSFSRSLESSFFKCQIANLEFLYIILQNCSLKFFNLLLQFIVVRHVFVCNSKICKLIFKEYFRNEITRAQKFKWMLF
jgi:hypothetical protein